MTNKRTELNLLYTTSLLGNIFLPNNNDLNQIFVITTGTKNYIMFCTVERRTRTKT